LVNLSNTTILAEMRTIEITGSFRKELGKKSSRELRNSNNVPCVIYGGKENIHFYTHENNFNKLVYTPDAHLVKLSIEGKEYEAVMKEIQFHPVTDKIIHIDFTEVSDNKPITINIPVRITGDAAGVKAGGKLRLKMRSLAVRGLVNDIPDYLTVDVTDLKIHQSVKVGDLSFNKIELLDSRKLMVVSVATSRVAQKTEEVEAEAEAAPATDGAEAPAEE
jgi:large subunit ribosomal protein L25